MKKLLNALLILTSLVGYLEWGGGNHGYLFQLEADIFLLASANFLSVVHPFILIPFLGQLLLLITLVQKVPGRLLTFIGMGCLSLIVLMLLLVGLLGMNARIIICALPFLVTAIFVIRLHRTKRST